MHVWNCCRVQRSLVTCHSPLKQKVSSHAHKAHFVFSLRLKEGRTPTNDTSHPHPYAHCSYPVIHPFNSTFHPILVILPLPAPPSPHMLTNKQYASAHTHTQTHTYTHTTVVDRSGLTSFPACQLGALRPAALTEGESHRRLRFPVLKDRLPGLQELLSGLSCAAGGGRGGGGASGLP